MQKLNYEIIDHKHTQRGFFPSSVWSMFSYHITAYGGEPMGERIDRGDYSMELVKRWTREMLTAVQHLHSNGVS